MTINIISTQIDKTLTRGPKKVLVNTLKGLDGLGIDYVFNRPINEYTYNWIHDDQKAIIEAGFSNKPVLVGPNTAILPKDLPLFRFKLPKGSIYLHPSEWTVNIWQFLGYREIKLASWAVGIDLNDFPNIERKDKSKVLLYFKQRDSTLLEEAKQILKKLALEYTLIQYGFYKEKEYLKALNECRFGIWIGCSESQGIGLQEALASNLPLIVLDATSIFDTVAIDTKDYFRYKFPKKVKNIKTTTVPYFDPRCGIKIEEKIDLEKSVLQMLSHIDQYKPREYIAENLSLEKCANQFLHFFDQIPTQESKRYNYKTLSKFLFYSGLVFQTWAWKWLGRKIYQ